MKPYDVLPLVAWYSVQPGAQRAVFMNGLMQVVKRMWTLCSLYFPLHYVQADTSDIVIDVFMEPR